MSDTEEIRGWLAGRLPKEWFEEAPEITVDRDEILVVGRLSEPEVAGDASSAEREAAVKGRIQGFREDTREQRMKIASEAERRFRRKVSWGAEVADVRKLFTNVSMPMMTRLRMTDRKVLDTLVETGVARSRSDALAWCVKLVAKHESEWLRDLEKAYGQVQDVRARGPRAEL